MNFRASEPYVAVNFGAQEPAGSSMRQFRGEGVGGHTASGVRILFWAEAG